MTIDGQLLEETAAELFEDAPCGYLTTGLDGTIANVNRTFERWSGYERETLLNRRRFQDLLSPGGRIYYETHLSPLLQMQGAVKEIALEIVRPDGSRLPALVNSVLHADATGSPRAIRTTVFDATDRRRYERELLAASERDRGVALYLQHSLLAGELPSSPSFELEVFYAPAGQEAEVGGDWYDAFWLGEPERIGLAVGDVVGHGLASATTMGQLRSALRAFASAGLGPSGLLEALDVYSRRYEVGAVTTIAYGELDPARGSFRFACAGHPPPLVCEPGAAPRFVWEGRSLPINPFRGPLRRDEHVLQLQPGSTLLLYTDGLIEHRGARADDDGMEELLRLVADRREQPLGALVSTIGDALFDPDLADDRSLVGVRLS